MLDFSTIYAAASWAGVILGIEDLAVAVVVVYVAWRGAKILANAVRGQ